MATNGDEAHDEATEYANSLHGRYPGDIPLRIFKLVAPVILVPYFALSVSGFKPEAIEIPLLLGGAAFGGILYVINSQKQKVWSATWSKRYNKLMDQIQGKRTG